LNFEGRTAVKKYAILIAVEEYADPAIDDVDHAKRDADEFSKALVLHGFDKTDQLILTNSQATKGVIELKVRTVIKRLQKGDVLYFYYAGHGFSKGAKNFITCHDTIDADWDGTSVALAPILGELQASECDRIALFLDCCESGIKATDGMRGIYDNLKVHELEQFLDNAKHCVCLTACRSDENSWSSNKLHHGIWTFHVIEAFKGEAPLALERGRFLTANSLQNYLKAEVPRTLLKTYTNRKDQTPWMYGASAGDFKLADLRNILEEKRESANKGVSLVAEMSFSVEEAEGLKSLSGWRKSYRTPDRFNGTTEDFAVRCATGDLRAHMDSVHDRLKSVFGFTRRDLVASDAEGGAGSIITPYFTYSVTVTLNPDELDEVIWKRTVDSIKEPSQITSAAFAKVFDGVFDTIEFSLPNEVDIEDFIDAAEAAKIPELQIQHDRDASYCTLELEDAVGTVTLRSDTLSVVHDRPIETQQLIGSFNLLRKLALEHNVPLISFSPTSKKLPSGNPKP
jgi:uncharacterized caspase-like protein